MRVNPVLVHLRRKTTPLIELIPSHFTLFDRPMGSFPRLTEVNAMFGMVGMVPMYRADQGKFYIPFFSHTHSGQSLNHIHI